MKGSDGKQQKCLNKALSVKAMRLLSYDTSPRIMDLQTRYVAVTTVTDKYTDIVVHTD